VSRRTSPHLIAEFQLKNGFLEILKAHFLSKDRTGKEMKSDFSIHLFAI
jgi:hypothetical protein